MLRLYRNMFILGPVLILLSAFLQVAIVNGSDKGWLLHAAHRWLAGDKLYVNIIEVNPPLIIWLYAVPVWLSLHVPGLRDYEALGLIGLLTVIFTTGVSARLIRLHPAFESDARRREEFILLLAAMFIFYTTQPYFFDREHIFLVLVFPYMLRFMPSLADQNLSLRMRALIACMAGIGCCIKPHTLIVFSALQLFALVRKRSFAPIFNMENYIIGGILLLYLAAILTFHPDYFRTIVPMAAATYASFRNNNTASLYFPPFFLALIMLFADFRPWQTTPYRRDVYYFLGICLAFFVYAYCSNGWGYTYNPLYTTLMFLAAWMLWDYDWLRREAAMHGTVMRHIRFGIRGAALVLIVHAAYIIMYLIVMGYNLQDLRASCREGSQECISRPYVQYLIRHDVHSFGTISYDFNNWVVLEYLANIRWVTRFNHVWMMPDLMLKGPQFRADHRWILEFVAHGYAEDLNRLKPDAMFIDDSPGFMGKTQFMKVVDYLQTVPQFKEAWSHYRLEKTFDNCKNNLHYFASARYVPSECKYSLYFRIPGS